MAEHKIKRALISVYDKTGIVDFARALVNEFGVEIISTGGTASLLKDSGVPVTLVEEVTGFPEMMDGRVKTLHPRIHAGILADRDNPEHMRQLEEQGIKPIDMVVVNLYPFEETVADPNCTFEQAIEMIDIGGPCLIRAAAKNHKHVLVVPYPSEYDLALGALSEKASYDERSLEHARSAYFKTACYDGVVHDWLQQHCHDVPDYHTLAYYDWGPMRYGENPHQDANLLQLYAEDSTLDLTCSDDVGGKEWQPHSSLNNFVDADAAARLCCDLTRELAMASVGPTFQSVIPPVTEELHTERHLPHIQNPGAHYFVTFRLASGSLAPAERGIVLEACRHWHTKKMTLHACVVMPDHVHLVITPHEVEDGKWVPLGEILRSVKGFSARQINERRGTKGSIWMDESWDRIVRNEKEYAERLEYIGDNSVKAGLGTEYPWLWINHSAWQDLAMYDRLESRSHRLGSPSDRSERQSSAPDGKVAVVLVKHTNACGVGVASDAVEAYRQAYLGDPNAAMGGILACGFTVDAEFAKAVMETYARWGKAAGVGGFFLEVWAADQFNEDALEVIQSTKPWGKRVRLFELGCVGDAPPEDEVEYRSVSGGLLRQTRDNVGLNEDQWKVATKRKPTESEMDDLRLAWLVCKHTKSNAITICRDGMLIGNGAGQMSRVMSCRIATWLAKENGHEDKLKGAAAASDAFFPFPDGPNILIDAGVTAIIQPGGSKRDDDTIAACDERDVAMIFTGTRHFKH